VGDILAIGQALYPSSDHNNVGFWNDLARNLFLGLTLYLIESPELPCTLGELLRQSSGKGLPLKDHLANIMKSRTNGDKALSFECIDALNRFCTATENTAASILPSHSTKVLKN
jgi:type IV secretion system protein VirD4